MIGRPINWNLTKCNIIDRLSMMATKDAIAEAMALTDLTLSRHLAGKGLTIDELVTFSILTGCTIEDLLVFEDDKYYSLEKDTAPGTFYHTNNQEVEHTTEEDIKEHFRFMQDKQKTYEIRDLKEFLLYLPFMEQSDVIDLCYRVHSYLHDDKMSHYIMEKLNYVYREIPDSPAKQFADWYRDNELRSKGFEYSNTAVSNGELDIDLLKSRSEGYMHYYNMLLHIYQSNK